MTNNCKIICVGDIAVGKTSIISRYIYDTFNAKCKTTNGVVYDFKEIYFGEEDIDLHIYDISSIEQFGNATASFYAGAMCAFIVFDVNRKSTLTNALKWKNDIDSKAKFPNMNAHIPIILLANKIDECSTSENKYCGKTSDEMDDFCLCNGFEMWIDVSAKKDINIDYAFETITKIIFKYKKIINDIIINKTFNTIEPFVFNSIKC